MRKRRRIIKRRIRNAILAWIALIFGTVMLLALLIIGSYFIVSAIGKNKLMKAGGSHVPDLMLEQPEEEEIQWQEGWVRYDGKIYEYNDNIMTFLVMGIDKEGEVTENPDAYSGGQSDALFLVVADRSTKKLSIIGINRDTMTDVKLYNVHAEGYEQTVTAQISTQYAFGDGMEFSCELTRDAVSALFFDLPINGYVTIYLDAVPELNDAVGGVDVTVLEDLTKKIPEWTEGTQVHLMGEEAFWYVKWRDITIFESNRGRMNRQRQYLTGYVAKAKEAVKQDITLPVTLYKKLAPYMVTDISVDETAYLAGELLNYRFDGEIYTLEGTTQRGEVHEEFYPDMDALRDLMIRIFYVEIDPDLY